MGPVFQGTFQAKQLMQDKDILQLSKYIHLNPVRSRLVRQPEEWHYSSYKEYLGTSERRYSNPKWILEMIGQYQDYQEYVLSFDGAFSIT